VPTAYTPLLDVQLMTRLMEDPQGCQEVHFRVAKNRRTGVPWVVSKTFAAKLESYAKADAELTWDLLRGPEPRPWWERVAGEDLV
jgi:hypothetical protein